MHAAAPSPTQTSCRWCSSRARWVLFVLLACKAFARLAVIPLIRVPHCLPPLQLSGLMKEGAPPKFSEKDIVEFIFFPVVNEGCRVIDEGEAGSAQTGAARRGSKAGQ